MTGVQTCALPILRVTAYGTTLVFPFEAEVYARSYADGQAFRLGVEVAELKRSA